MPEFPADNGGVTTARFVLIAVVVAGCASATRAHARAPQSWRAVEYPLDAEGLGVCVEVTGRTQLGGAEIVFASGERRPVTLRPEHVYGPGLYALAQFDGLRRVARVRVALRPRARRSDVRMLLLRGDHASTAAAGGVTSFAPADDTGDAGRVGAGASAVGCVGPAGSG